MLKSLENNEHAEHIAHAGHAEGHAGEHAIASRFSTQIAALMVATFAAALALSEQGAKHAEIKVQANLIAATDAWAQYQAKSTRATLSGDISDLIGTMEPASNPEVADRRAKTVARLQADKLRFETDPKDGKDAVGRRAHDFEHARDYALEQTHAYHNGAAALELGIVLATASAIIGSRLLIRLAFGIGVLGAACAIAGFVAPEWGAF